MRNTFITITTTLGALVLVTTATYAIGTLTPSGTAGDGTQYSLNDIYTKLTTGATTTVGTGTMTVPGTVSASFRTLTEIYNAIPDLISSTTTTEVIEGEGELLLQTPEGIYDSDSMVGAPYADIISTYPAITAENIKDGVTIFGVEGSLVSGVPKSGQTTSYTLKDDGDLEAGIAMSYTASDNGTAEITSDDTVTDNVTGLVWQKDGAYNATSWGDAVSYCASNVAGLPGTGWRLPNYKELISILDLGREHPSINPVFTNTYSDYYWSGTTYLGSTGYKWSVDFNIGYVDRDSETTFDYYARCVR